jgi:predicted acylesterase/phospholipase RssA
MPQDKKGSSLQSGMTHSIVTPQSPVPNIVPSSFDHIILAGGGNRCWWQAGVLKVWQQHCGALTRRFTGVSAGAAIAAAHLTQTLTEAMRACRELYSENDSIWVGQPGHWFAHTHIYPAWLRAFFTPSRLVQLREPQLQVGIARLPRGIPRLFESVGITLGIAMYLVEKGGARSVHARWPRRFGFRMELHPIGAVTEHAKAIELLCASAAGVPFMPAQQIEGRTAIDGGFADHAPQPILHVKGKHERQLVLLTRHTAHRPQLFEFNGRTYAQPSREIPVSTWDCTRHCDITPAYELGLRDGRALLSRASG